MSNQNSTNGSYAQEPFWWEDTNIPSSIPSHVYTTDRSDRLLLFNPGFLIWDLWISWGYIGISRGPKESLKHGANVNDHMYMIVFKGRKIINFIQFQIGVGYKNIKDHIFKGVDILFN